MTEGGATAAGVGAATEGRPMNGENERSLSGMLVDCEDDRLVEPVVDRGRVVFCAKRKEEWESCYGCVEKKEMGERKKGGKREEARVFSLLHG